MAKRARTAQLFSVAAAAVNPLPVLEDSHSGQYAFTVRRHKEDF